MFFGILFFTGLLLIALSLGVGLGTMQAALVSFGCFAINLTLFKMTWEQARQYLIIKLILTFFLVQPLAFGLLTSIYPDLTMYMCINTSLFSGGAYTLIYSFTLVPVIALLFAKFLTTVSSLDNPEPAHLYYDRVTGNHMYLILFIGAFFNLLPWIEAALPNVVGYGFRVVDTLFSIVPVLAGYYWARNSTIRYMWLISLSIGMFLAIVTGNRGYGFFPLMYYVCGFVLQL